MGGTVYDCKRNKIIEWKVTQFGYATVGIKYVDKYRNQFVHRLVGKAFIPNPKNKPQINHKKADKLYNHFINLEWATSQENMTHVSENRLHPRSVYCCEINKNREIIGIYNSINDAARKHDNNPRHVQDCCDGIQNTSYGRMYRYYDDIDKRFIETRFDKNGFKQNRKRRKVKCVENNKVYKNQRSAAKDLSITQARISKFLRGETNKRVDGYTFTYVD